MSDVRFHTELAKDHFRHTADHQAGERRLAGEPKCQRVFPSGQVLHPLHDFAGFYQPDAILRRRVGIKSDLDALTRLELSRSGRENPTVPGMMKVKLVRRLSSEVGDVQ